MSGRHRNPSNNKAAKALAAALLAGGLLLAAPAGIALAKPGDVTPGSDKGDKDGWKNPRNPHYVAPPPPPPPPPPGGGGGEEPGG